MSEIIVGPRDDNNCCICCHKCEWARTLPHGCVADCCPCPDLDGGSMNANITIKKSDGSTCGSFTVSLTASDGEILCDDDPMACYQYVGPNGKSYEKWGNEGGHYCGDGADCEGQYIDLALCCCPDIPQGVDYDCAFDPIISDGDCNACNFQLFMNFMPGSGPDYEDEGIFECSCPDGYEECQMVPGDTPSSEGPKSICLNLRHAECSQDGTPFLIFSKDDQYWNCDCCFGGCEEADTVDITVIIF